MERRAIGRGFIRRIAILLTKRKLALTCTSSHQRECAHLRHAYPDIAPNGRLTKLQPTHTDEFWHAEGVRLEGAPPPCHKGQPLPRNHPPQTERPPRLGRQSCAGRRCMGSQCNGSEHHERGIQGAIALCCMSAEHKRQPACKTGLLMCTYGNAPGLREIPPCPDRPATCRGPHRRHPPPGHHRLNIYSTE